MPPDHIYLALSANRQNITYATTPPLGGPRNFHNFDFLIPAEYRPPMMIPKTLVFHDNKQEAADVAVYNDSRPPKQLQNQGIVKHYHSDMSAEYLQQTYDETAIFYLVLGHSTIRLSSTTQDRLQHWHFGYYNRVSHHRIKVSR